MLGAENRLGNQIQIVTAALSFGFGIMSAFYGNNSHILLLCMGREEAFKYNLEYTIGSYNGGVAFNMRLYHPFRLSFNIVLFIFVIIVPVLYYKVFRFRQDQANTVPGLFHFPNTISA